MPEGHMIDI